MEIAITSDPAYSVIQKNSTLRYSNIRLVNGRLTGRQRYRYWGATSCNTVIPLKEITVLPY